MSVKRHRTQRAQRQPHTTCTPPVHVHVQPHMKQCGIQAAQLQPRKGLPAARSGVRSTQRSCSRMRGCLPSAERGSVSCCRWAACSTQWLFHTRSVPHKVCCSTQCAAAKCPWADQPMARACWLPAAALPNSLPI
eukprot:349667-Chlamydomonas_euryale.AAC.1